MILVKATAILILIHCVYCESSFLFQNGKGLHLASGKAYTMEVKAWGYDHHITSSIIFSQIFEVEIPTKGTMEVFIYRIADGLGYENNFGERELCCSRELQQNGICSDIGKAITTEKNNQVFRVNFQNNLLTRLDQEFFPRAKTHTYFISYVNCLDVDVSIRGTVIYTYHYGSFYAKVYETMLSVIYILFILAYGIICTWKIFWYFPKIDELQQYTSIILLLGLILSICQYVDFHEDILILQVIIAIVNSLVKLVILALSMGYGLNRNMDATFLKISTFTIVIANLIIAILPNSLALLPNLLIVFWIIIIPSKFPHLASKSGSIKLYVDFFRMFVFIIIFIIVAIACQIQNMSYFGNYYSIGDIIGITIQMSWHLIYIGIGLTCRPLSFNSILPELESIQLTKKEVLSPF